VRTRDGTCAVAPIPRGDYRLAQSLTVATMPMTNSRCVARSQHVEFGATRVRCRGRQKAFGRQQHGHRVGACHQLADGRLPAT
jgi:hypothetical protein